MTLILRRAACTGIGLAVAAFFAFAGIAHAQDVTVGGVVEVIGGTSDTGVDGLSRGLFSRINVGYSNTLDNGLEISASISYQVNQRGSGGTAAAAIDPDAVMAMAGDPDMAGMMMTANVTGFESTTNYAPDILSISVGGGFGTVSIGAHAPASCAMLPRPIAFVPGGVNATWYTLFTGFNSMNVVFAETNYCGTSEAISYATPTMGGLAAMITYAPNMSANQGVTVSNAASAATNKPDYINVAGTFSSDMGGMNLSIGAAFQTSSADANGNEIDSQSIAGAIGVGGATLGAAWFDNGNISGQTVGAKYSMGSLTPAITYSQQEDDTTGEEETALVVGATYAVGGGLSVFVEYMGLEESGGVADDDDTLLMGGVIVAF
jgi:hypothetical protein